MDMREARAPQVNHIAEKFVEVVVTVAGENDVATIYCQTVQCHIHEYIRWYGDLLLNYGCHGSDHAHSVNKNAC